MAFKKDTKIKSNFQKITIGLASPEEILENSFGEVLAFFCKFNGNNSFSRTYLNYNIVITNITL